MNSNSSFLGADFFDVDERILLNGCANGAFMAELTRQRILEHMRFILSSSSDESIVSLTEGLLSKVNNLTDMEWNALKAIIPFPVAYDSATDVSEVPTDEDEV